MRDWSTRQEFYEKHASDPELYAMINYLHNIYNTVGILYNEDLMSLNETAQLYTPIAIINVWERFEWMIFMNRMNCHGEESYLNYLAPFENLYREMKRKYPKVDGWVRSPEEWEERRQLREKNIFSKMPNI